MQKNKQLVPLKRLWIDINILNFIQKQGIVFPEELEENVVDLGTFPLQEERLQRVQKMKIKRPINVVKCRTMYTVLDGRHRLADSIMKGEKEIECLIMDD